MLKGDHQRAFIQDFVTVPYIMDLESTNGTVLNGDKIEPAKYYELRTKDTPIPVLGYHKMISGT